MNANFFSLIPIALVGLLSSAALAYTEAELVQSMGVLEDQAYKMSLARPRLCPEDYKKYAVQKDLKISLFYGYEDFEKETQDLLHAKAMVNTLALKCEKGLTACGFRIVQQTPNFTRLTKTLRGQKVHFSVYATSYSNDNAVNMDPGSTYWKQDKMSRQIKAAFSKDLVEADVVFYAGHSRGGGGPGFDPQTKVSLAVNYLFRAPLKPMLSALSQRPSRLKMLGLFSCQAEKYYRHDIERVNPDVALLLSVVDIDADSGEQAALGALDSILGQKCQDDFAESMRVAIDPTTPQMLMKLAP